MMAVSIRKISVDRRHEIEQTALDLAYEHGPDKVSTGMIADHLGITQPAIYKHFRRKEDIWAAGAKSLAQKIGENVSFAQQAHSSPKKRLKCLVMEHIKLVEQNPALPELMTMRGGKDDHYTFQVTIQAAMAQLRLAIESDFALGIERKEFCMDVDPADASQLIFGLIQSLVLRMLVSRNNAVLQNAVLQNDGERLLDLLLNGFMAKEKTP